jgi:catechol 2,3-dioxygenase-like lactoylglutathione lyase family enzyme
MAITGMNHFNILTDDVDTTVDFYRDVVGLEPGPRPDLGFPGAWLYADGRPILHVSGGRPKEQLKPGVIDHMAFSARGLAETLARLDQRGIHYAHRRQVGAGTWQVFFFDPNGARVELDFDPNESEPAKAGAADRSVLPS